MGMYDEFRIMGAALKTATPEDAEEKTRAFEEEWFRASQHIGCMWEPARLEAQDERVSRWDLEDRFRRCFSALALFIALEAAAIAALAIVILH